MTLPSLAVIEVTIGTRIPVCVVAEGVVSRAGSLVEVAEVGVVTGTTIEDEPCSCVENEEEDDDEGEDEDRGTDVGSDWEDRVVAGVV